jgi:hypothetical protein
MRLRVVLASCVAVAATLLSFGDLGCGSTGSKRFVFDARAGGIERDATQPHVFTNERGWTITLTKAAVTIGPVYLNVVAPLRSGETSWMRPFIRSAFAHDEHLGEGRVVGEVLAQVTIDALSPVLVPFGSQGSMTQEHVRTADVFLWPPPETPPETTNIDAASAELAGEAVRGKDHVRFRGRLVIDDAWASDAKPGERSATPISEIRQVRGVPASFYPVEGGALEIRVDVCPLFRGADFSNLAANPTDADGTKILVQSKDGAIATDQVMRNVFQGLRASSGTYAIRWATP